MNAENVASWSAELMSVRVRFAPSPTGFLHVGGARTALFNWLYARHHGGTFVLRVEDTDVARERPEYREEIFRALSWLGLEHDEGPTKGGPYGPYSQRERLHLYREAADKLAALGLTYPCFCGTRVDETYETSDDEPEDPKTSKRCPCSMLSADEIATKTAALDATPAMRMRVDQTATHHVHDLIRGDVAFPPGEVEDFIVTKAGGDPLYNFTNVVDDAAMHITHIIRGEEHLANTPKQIVLYRALDLPVPQFAHLPIILNAERKKLSKRDGATAVFEYRKLGYLPQGLVNFLALLGWSPGEDRELLTLDQMVALFDLDRVQKHGAVFDTVKLTWMNGEYLKTAPITTLVDEVVALLNDAPDAANLRTDRAHVAGVCELLRERAKTIAEITTASRYFFTRETNVGWQHEAVAKRVGTPEARAHLRSVGVALDAHDGPWDRVALEVTIRAAAIAAGAKAGDLIGPLRVAVTGYAVSAGIFETVELLGREITLGRIDAFFEAHAEALA